METTELTCIVCPMGCSLKVEKDGEKIISVSGNTCKRGHDYAVLEILSPSRVLTTTVRTDSGELLPVKSKGPLPKGRLFEYMEIINAAAVKTPVRIGDVIVKNIDGTGIDIVSAKNIL